MNRSPSTPEDVRRLAIVGRALWNSVLIGDAPPAIARLRERMWTPRPGDLVMEISRLGQGFDPDSVGTLLRIEGAFPDDRYVVEPLHAPGAEQGWRNAQFIALPTDHVTAWADGDTR